MARPRICVIRAPGTNCDVETAHAFRLCGAQAERTHLFALLREPQRLHDFQILCIPGGFSYGDDIGAGVIFGTQLRVHLADALAEFLQRDTLVLGICNGFQVLVKSGLLPDGPGGLSKGGGGPSRRRVTLTWNDNGRYTCRWVSLRVDNPRNAFLRNLETLELPVAHAEGRIAVSRSDLLPRWRANGQIALSYTWHTALLGTTLPAGPNHMAASAGGRPAAASGGTVAAEVSVLPYPHNPNGSVGNIAGLSDPSGRILGLMPHPERYLFAHQHPRWTRGDAREPGDGMALFRNAVDYYA